MNTCMGAGESSRYFTLEDSMHSQKNSPACFLRWSVSKVVTDSTLCWLRHRNG